MTDDSVAGAWVWPAEEENVDAVAVSEGFEKRELHLAYDAGDEVIDVSARVDGDFVPLVSVPVASILAVLLLGGAAQHSDEPGPERG